MRSLSEHPDSIKLFKPRKQLADLVLTKQVEISAREIIREWNCLDLLAEWDLEPRHSVLFHGPSGNGKTALAEALAHQLGVDFGLVQQSDLIGMYKGQTAKTMDRMFDQIRDSSCVVCFDECDFLLSSRFGAAKQGGEREANAIVNEFLMQMDRLTGGCLLVFTTNLPNTLDAAAKRRILLQVEIPKPTADALDQLSEKLIEKWPFISQRREWWSVPAESFAEREEQMRSAARRMIVEGLVT